jgi:transcriptional regulator with XRE-family HTH domain
MTTLGNRISKLRKDKNMSQSDLALKAGVSYAQIGRYEIKGAQPPAEVLKKIADALATTSDFLINGDKDEKAKEALKDTELLQQFKEVDNLNDDDKSTIKKLIGAFLFKSKIQKQLAL